MFDITASCRTCMKDNVTLIDLYEIVEVEENYLQLAELLVQCTPIEVSKEDGLPQKLCDDCVKVLQLTYSFRKQATKAQDEFKKLLERNVKTEPQEVDLKTENDHDYFANYEDFNFNPDFSKNEIEDKEYTCSKCNKQFTKEKKYLKHLEAHENLSLECDICKKLYSSQALLDKHRAKHVENMCFVGDQSLSSDTQLMQKNIQILNIAEQEEIEVKTEETPLDILQCAHCRLTFTKQRSLSMHMRKHRNVKTKKEFICDTCGKTFTMKHLLKRHVVMHSKVKPHKCEKCSKTYARRDQLISHMYSHKEHKPYVCEYCKKSFSQMCSLKDHLRTHTGETPFLCSECGKGFSNNSNLRQHMMRHSGVKPYACNLCPKTFCTKGQMRSHVSTHTGEHPFKCEECGAAFTKQNSLKKHSMIHLAIRPFACETCNMRFTCKDHLKRHTRIHTGEKPYKCKYCERAFSQSNDLVKHTRQHIGQNIYQCTICGSRFRLLSELKHHYPVHFANGEGNDPQISTKENTETNTNEVAKLPVLEPKPSEFNFLAFKSDKGLHPSLLLKAPEVDKDLPMLGLKPAENVDSDPSRSLVDSNRIVITINSCDTNGVVNGITIKLPPKES
ncbi:hypothetical protein PYW08_011621 [Mythimna loreyi]|uniref:Uncharacterized protein n=1 Tax=Mythimna loreyi TaxID=667449 RepID=A0ACC2QK14_9NEOP|nr:hypothetical protein PYW08_011621 [Mythimna loreyi]